MAMFARPYFVSIFMMTMLAGLPAHASDRCMISYRVDASLQLTDTYLGKGDALVKGLAGSMVIEYPLDKDGAVTDGKVRVLHFSVFEKFTIETIADITTTLHHFAPTCNGTAAPTWRSPKDKGFPIECAYTGDRQPVAVGKLSRESNAITCANCKADDSYWAKDRSAYVPGDE
ncbi:MAG: hypothetical protein WBN38_04305, partial [Polyangiales bacterium]